jgi:hypothetical protein
MARVRADEIVDHLGSDFRKIFKELVEKADLDADAEELYQIFKRIARRKFGWENVPDSYVEAD